MRFFAAVTAAAILAVAPALVAPALADGFVVKDLSAINLDTSQLSAGEWVSRLDPDRATFACFGCAGDPVIDVQIGRQDDGTESRVRSGETTMDDMQSLCQQKDPSCTLEGLNIAPAVGWATRYNLGGQAAQTVVVLRDGDLLTLRVLSSDPVLTAQNAEALIRVLVPQIVGP